MKKGSMGNKLNQEPRSKTLDEILAIEWSDYKNRLTKYEAELTQATTVKVVIGCDDSRVDVPVGLQDNGDFYILLPVIGGGVPSRDGLASLILYLTEKRGSLSNVEIYASQHGGNEEVSATISGEPVPKHTCGARAVRGEMPDSVYQKYAGIPRHEVPEALDEEMNLPAMLVHSAANLEADIVANAQKTVAGITEILAELNSSEVPVYSAVYNHNKKTLTTLNGEGLEEETAEMPGFHNFEKDYQDPAMTVGKFGPRLAGIADGVLAPYIIGLGENNDFNTYAATFEDLKVLFSDMSYAVSHHAKHINHPDEPHADHNFESLKHALIFVQDTAYAEQLDTYINTDFFQSHYAQIFASVGGLHVQNVDTGKVRHYIF